MENNLKDVKILGIIGSILNLIGIALVGSILEFLAMKKLSDITGNKEIFKKFVHSIICGLLSIFAFVLAVVVFFIKGVEWLWLIPLFLISYVLNILFGYFLKKSYDFISFETKTEIFHTTGQFYMLGAIFVPIVVGFLLYGIGSILKIIAFSSLPDVIK